MKLNRNIFILAFANALNSGGYALSVPFFAVYLHAERGLPASIVGLISAGAMLCTSAASALSGELSDVFGRKKVMAWSLFFRSVNALLMAAAIYLHAHYLWAAAFYFMGSFTGAFFRPASNAWIADNVAPHNRIQAFGYIRIGLNIGWALGPAVGGALAAKSFALAFTLTGVFFLLTSLFLQLNIKETFTRAAHRRASFGDMVKELKNERLAFICGLIFMISLVSAQLVTGLSLHSIKYIKLTEAQVGWLFSINGAVVVLLQYHSGRLMAKTRLTTALICGCLMYGTGYIILGAAGGFMIAALGVIFFSAGEMSVSPGSNTLISNIAPDRARGRYLGMQELARQAGTAAGMFGAGMMIEYLSPFHQIIPWLAVGAASFIAAYGFYRLRPKLNYREEGLNEN